ncbi:MAG: hypothetical protein C6I00_04810 [Nitratiruptor sp.]|nr:hypothetical protein [Nitratiruptor sp.]NPA84230.1 cytochrome c [Campylobacterota bacterium]
MGRIIVGTLLLASLLFGKEAEAIQGERLFNRLGCYGCHGIGGVGTNTFPKLAGKPKDYLIAQLKAYRDGQRTSARADMMRPFAKKLSDQEIEQIAAYLSAEEQNIERYDEEYDLTDPM